MKTCQNVTVLHQSELASGIYDLELAYPDGQGPDEIRPGQFVGVYCRDGSRLLPRPISICEWTEETGTRLRLVYRVAGKGTEELSSLKAGEKVRVLGILGNGYEVSLLAGRRVLLIGGGIGAPPLLGLARSIGKLGHESITAVLGYRSGDLFLKEEFEPFGEVIVATDDGSAGIRGTVIDAVHQTMERQGGDFGWDVICACGPLPMLRGVKELAAQQQVPCYLSMEERMACGVGACLGCVTKTTATDAHSKVHNARVCTEGPVFRAEDVVL